MKFGLIFGVLVLTGLVFFTAVQSLPGAQAAAIQPLETTEIAKAVQEKAAQENAKLQAAVASLEKENVSLSSTIAAERAEKSELEGRLASLEAQTAEKGTSDANTADAAQNLEAIKQELAAAKEASKTIEEAAEAKAAEFALAQNKAMMLEEKIVELENTAKDAAAQIAKLEADLNAPESAEALAAEAKLIAERDAALAEMASLKNAAKDQARATSELATLVAAIKMQVSSLKADMNERESMIADLEASLQLASVSPVASCQQRTDALTASIRFNAGATSTSADSQTALDELAVIVAECVEQDFWLEIEGHTDSAGGIASNLLLSNGRASAIQDFLVENGVPEQSMRSVGFGSSDPIADNATPEGRVLNRRIVFDWEYQ